MVTEAALVGIKICQEQSWGVQATFQYNNDPTDIELYFIHDKQAKVVMQELEEKGYEVFRDSNFPRRLR